MSRVRSAEGSLPGRSPLLKGQKVLCAAGVGEGRGQGISGGGQALLHGQCSKCGALTSELLAARVDALSFTPDCQA